MDNKMTMFDIRVQCTLMEMEEIMSLSTPGQRAIAILFSIRSTAFVEMLSEAGWMPEDQDDAEPESP